VELRLLYIPSQYLTKVGLFCSYLWVSGDNVFFTRSSRGGYNPTTSLTGTFDRYTYNPISNYTIGVG
jgi:hypothetical protein